MTGREEEEEPTVDLTAEQEGEEGEDDQIRWIGSARVSGPPWMRNFLVTAGFLGFTSVWAIENSQVSPYLIELGLSKSYMSLVFVAGPLSGLVMQPLVGIMSDRCQSSWGRRRPFILGGMALTVIGMLLLGWTKELSSLILGEGNHKTLSIVIAVISVFLVDFSISAVQAADRALLVDTFPQAEQETGNAWAGRLSGFGRVAAFWIGNINLPKAVPFFGKTQLQALSIITSLILISTHVLTLSTTHERVLLSSPHPKPSFLSNFRSIISTTRSLPPDIRTICFVQFFAWIAWFPILFFTSVWVSDLYTANAVDSARIAGLELGEGLYDEATRAGSRALLFSALIAFATAILLPLAVEAGHDQEEDLALQKAEGWRKLLHLPIKGLSLPLVWCVSLGMFSFLMGCTFFVSSVWSANLVIGLTGFCWAVTYWAPFAILGELILEDSTPSTADFVPLRTRSHDDDSSPATCSTFSQEQHETAHFLLESEDDGLEEEGGSEKEKSRTPNGEKQEETTPRSSQTFYNSSRDHTTSTQHPAVAGPSRPHSLRSVPPSPSSSQASLDSLPTSPSLPSIRPNNDNAAQAGAILGIHNLFIVLPQFLITFLSSILFRLLEPPKTSAIEGIVSKKYDAVGFVFRFGGVSAAVACYLCFRFMRRKARRR